MNKREDNVITNPRINETNITNNYAIEKYPKDAMSSHERHINRRTDGYGQPNYQTISLVLVRLNHVAYFIVNADHGQDVLVKARKE